MFRDESGNLPVESFDSAHAYWDWFFDNNDKDPNSDLFDDFSLTGCWNWLLTEKNRDEFGDILNRITAAKELHIPAGNNCGYDDQPAILIEKLLLANAELNKAQSRWQKQNNTT